MEFRELIKNNRSYREFDHSTAIPHEQLLSWIDTARFTPSTVNLQALKYIIADTDDDCNFIRSHVHFAGKLPGYTGPDSDHNPAAYIVIICDRTIAPNFEPFDKDVGIVAQTILLAAVNDGFGGCMIGAYDSTPIAEYFNLGDKYTARLIIALGKPETKVVLTEMEAGGSTVYYRDENNTHYVPKRSLDEVVIK